MTKIMKILKTINLYSFFIFYWILENASKIRLLICTLNSFSALLGLLGISDFYVLSIMPTEEPGNNDAARAPENSNSVLDGDGVGNRDNNRCECGHLYGSPCRTCNPQNVVNNHNLYAESMGQAQHAHAQVNTGPDGHNWKLDSNTETPQQYTCCTCGQSFAGKWVICQYCECSSHKLCISNYTADNHNANASSDSSTNTITQTNGITDDNTISNNNKDK